MNKIKECMKRAARYLLAFLKWSAVSVAIGFIGGGIGALFHRAVETATRVRTENDWLLFLLPVAGLIIVGMYRLSKLSSGTGTNEVFESIRTNQRVPLILTPLIFLSTVLTHLFGGSAGREGAALQIGGSIGFQCGAWLQFGEKDRHIATLCGMSAVFSALFGTPLTATVFSIEVISVGVFYYAAFVPCILAALVAYGVAQLFGAGGVSFSLTAVPALSIPAFFQVIVLGALCALVSIGFCLVMKKTRVYLARWIPNEYLRALAGGAAVVALTLICGTRDYNGAGMEIITKAIAGSARPEAFALKLLFTAITLAAGLKGGEIVPTLFVGATFGCTAGALLGMDPGFGAAVGMVAMFCGVTNTPISSILLSIELFGIGGLPFFAVASGVSYMLSGYFGIYSSQKILYSKIKDEFINTHAV